MCCSCLLEFVSEGEFDVGVVVQCIRLSSNPQTHHHAYSFLSTAAAIFPVSAIPPCADFVAYIKMFPGGCVVVVVVNVFIVDVIIVDGIVDVHVIVYYCY